MCTVHTSHSNTTMMPISVYPQGTPPLPPPCARSQVGTELAEIPSGPLRELGSFQLLLFVRCFQPRAFISAALQAVREALGPGCSPPAAAAGVASELFDLEAAFAVSSCTAPLVVISAVDQPLPQLLKFAEMRGQRSVSCWRLGGGGRCRNCFNYPRCTDRGRHQRGGKQGGR